METMSAIDETVRLIRQISISTSILTLAFLMIDEVLELLLFRADSDSDSPNNSAGPYSSTIERFFQQSLDFIRPRAKNYAKTFSKFQCLISLPRLFICIMFHAHVCDSTENLFVNPLLVVLTFTVLKLWQNPSVSQEYGEVITGSVGLTMLSM